MSAKDNTPGTPLNKEMKLVFLKVLSKGQITLQDVSQINQFVGLIDYDFSKLETDELVTIHELLVKANNNNS